MKNSVSLLLVFFVFLTFFSNCKTKFNKSCEAVENPDCVCLQIYEPVCGCNDVTYPNSCYAECASITDYEQGECQ